MQVLVLYYSQTGNTKELAEAIAEGVRQLDDVAVIVRTTDEVTKTDFLNSQGIIAGSPVFPHEPLREAQPKVVSRSQDCPRCRGCSRESPGVPVSPGSGHSLVPDRSRTQTTLLSTGTPSPLDRRRSGHSQRLLRSPRHSVIGSKG